MLLNQFEVSRWQDRWDGMTEAEDDARALLGRSHQIGSAQRDKSSVCLSVVQGRPLINTNYWPEEGSDQAKQV